MRIDDGEWQEQREVEMMWLLHEGENELRVRAVNAFGRAGRVATVRVCYGK